MGQQQLLLVILVTIIVGIATVVAINTFGTAADQANVDAVNQDIATIAAAGQGFYMKPTMLGGGSRTFTDITFEGMAVPGTVSGEDDRTLTNENGVYTITATDENSFTISAQPESRDGDPIGAIITQNDLDIVS